MGRGGDETKRLRIEAHQAAVGGVRSSRSCHRACDLDALRAKAWSSQQVADGIKHKRSGSGCRIRSGSRRVDEDVASDDTSEIGDIVR
jgi:hypothetical protein